MSLLSQSIVPFYSLRVATSCSQSTVGYMWRLGAVTRHFPSPRFLSPQKILSICASSTRYSTARQPEKALAASSRAHCPGNLVSRRTASIGHEHGTPRHSRAAVPSSILSRWLFRSVKVSSSDHRLKTKTAVMSSSRPTAREVLLSILWPPFYRESLLNQRLAVVSNKPSPAQSRCASAPGA